MKVCKLWLPALFLGLVGGAALICDTLYNGTGRGFFLSSDVCAAVFVISVVLLIIVGYVMSAMSRNIGLESTTPGKNPGAGIFGFISSASIIGLGVITMLSFGTSDSQFLAGLSAVLSMFGGIVLLYESCISFTGHNGMVKRPLLSFGPVLWCCGKLLVMFLNYQRVSLYAAVKYDVISTSLLLMFLFYHAMYLSQPEKPVALRRMTLYGIMYIACIAAVCGDIIVKMFVPSVASEGVDAIVIEPTISRILTCVSDISLAGYAAFFITGAHRNSVYKLIEDEEEESDEDTEFLGSLSEDKQEEAAAVSGGLVIEKEEHEEKPDTSEGSIDVLFSAAAQESKAETPADAGEAPAATMTYESVTEEPAAAPMTYENVTEEPAAAPMTYESVTEEPAAAPMTYESVAAEPETLPVTPQSAANEPADTAEAEKAAAPEAVQNESKSAAPNDLIEELEAHAEQDEQRELDEMFADSDEDYEELFKILDEMSGGE